MMQEESRRPFEAEKYADFEERVNMLGLDAVLKRDGSKLDFETAMRKLREYFAEGILYWCYQKAGVTEDDLKNPLFASQQVNNDVAWNLYAKLMKTDSHGEMNYIRILNNKVLNFTDEFSIGDKPFFNYLALDLGSVIKEKTELYYQEQQDGISNIFSQKERRLLKKLKDLQEAYDVPMSKIISLVSQAENLPEKKLTELWVTYNDVNVYRVGSDSDDDSDSYMEDLLFGSYTETFEEVDVTRELLLKLNEIYRNSFFEKHKQAFPPHLTNEILNANVKANQKVNQNFADAVKEHWIAIDEPGLRIAYEKPEYLCISPWIFDWFEKVRRRILGKEIANRIGFSESNYTKTIKEALDIILKDKKINSKI